MKEPGDDSAERHAEKMRKKKEARDRILERKTCERGLLIVHTGTGKGKTTAAFGLVIRALGHGMRVGIVQFIKGAMNTGEREALERFRDLVTIEASGPGFSWETQDLALDIAASRAAWERAMAMLVSPGYPMVVLDELNVALRHGHLPLEEVLSGLRGRPAGMHVVVTGRHAPEALVEMADIVTEMTLVKHPFRSGVKAQAGIEY